MRVRVQRFAPHLAGHVLRVKPGFLKHCSSAAQPGQSLCVSLHCKHARRTPKSCTSNLRRRGVHRVISHAPRLMPCHSGAEQCSNRAFPTFENRASNQSHSLECAARPSLSLRASVLLLGTRHARCAHRGKRQRAAGVQGHTTCPRRERRVARREWIVRDALCNAA
eukprot:3687586-Pleurochrysis_carterae.AAC.1